MEHKYMGDNHFAIRIMKNFSGKSIIGQQEILDLHEDTMKEMLLLYRKLIKENKLFLEEVDQGCREQIRESMAYALEYLEIYDPRVNMRRLCAAMDDVVFLYGLSAMIERCLTLVRCFVPKKGKLYNDIIHGYFCNDEGNSDEEVMDMLPEYISRRQYYRAKKEAIRWMGFYFYEVVVPQMMESRLIIS